MKEPEGWAEDDYERPYRTRGAGHRLESRDWYLHGAGVRARSADVAINYHSNADAALGVAAKVRSLGRRAEVYQADVTSEADCERLAAQTVADFGHVDILVNNAGIGASTIGMPTIGDLTTHDLESLLAHHVKGPFFLSRALLPQMRTLGRADIIMVSSQAAQSLAARMGVVYNIAKAGMEALAHTIAKEERQYGARVNIVAPGLVDTELGELLIKVRSGQELLDAVRDKAALRLRLRARGHRQRNRLPLLG